MLTKFPKPSNTLLSKNNEPLSNKDRAQLDKEWAEHTLDSLLAYTKTDPSFGMRFCKKVESNDGLAKQIRRHLRDASKGKPKGPRTWAHSRYLQMLIHYEMLCATNGRREALEWIGENEGIGVQGVDGFNPKKVEDKITKARKEISDDELATYLPPWVKNPPQ